MAESPQSRKNNAAVKEALAAILMTEVADPRLATLTVSTVKVSKDRSVAVVYILADRVDEASAIAGLESAKGRIRSLLGTRLGWKQTPKLRFELDPMMEHAARIEAVLRDAPPSFFEELEAEAGTAEGTGDSAGAEDDN